MEARLYEELLDENSEAEDWVERLNPNSLCVCQALGEPSLANVQAGERFQFVRNGFFCADTKYHKPEHPVFNRTVSLKSSWQPAKTE